MEDLGYLSDKFEYKEKLGRPRKWKKDQIAVINEVPVDIEEFFKDLKKFQQKSDKDRRISELLISLLTGSINNIYDIDIEEPKSLLEKVKQKIVLFDGDQTRFIFEEINQPMIRIQGLAGTGKTELLLHKLKELYTTGDDTKIAFTCHNKVLASSLRNRIPDFFTFMKVEEQIAWEERLFVFHSWGSSKIPNSGLYSKICQHYELPFHAFNFGDFKRVCQEAIKDLSEKEEVTPLFDYILIDESQDFSEEFFQLCSMVTKNSVYIAGDIFQTIFVKQSTDVSPDFLLNKCYRTDPRTLMFSQAVGLGLYERPVINWLNESELKACGYDISIDGNQYTLSRPKVRRFDDSDEDFIPVEIERTSSNYILESIIETINKIKSNNPTVEPNDIGIVFIDANKKIYNQIDQLEYRVYEEFQWDITKGYENKEQVEGTLFVSNRNNVKGLEFPFVICVTDDTISQNISLRNVLYMTLTRSFISTYLIMTEKNQDLGILWDEKLNDIISQNRLVIQKPEESDILSEEELRIDKAKYQNIEEMRNDIFRRYNITNTSDRIMLTEIVELHCKNKINVTKSDVEKIIRANINL
ncbi:hypothetical protein A5868_002228 [Enterococcus sp. 12F9_DIV0723]|uniref:DEAD/DEAH box helicase n=1 Tax=Enterococcus sp. 12F9_DIV0723 TaxID=1834169 RepID=UPI000B3EB9DD|nr:AAA family ATPase [Enterococcus sp. 12F9_DIV0723]OUZ17288.1 hypothetical protein A5868_002228 [Enterococcus sp. 12F9_DIV0723]